MNRAKTVHSLSCLAHNLHSSDAYPQDAIEQLFARIQWIEYENEQLIIRGGVASRNAGLAAVCQEFGVEDFQHVFAIGEAINADAISAEVHNGVLAVRLPRKAKLRAKRIAVTRSDSPALPQTLEVVNALSTHSAEWPNMCCRLAYRPKIE